MELAHYLEFLDPLDIRVKGTRIGLDDVVYAFRQGMTPDEIVTRYHSLTLEQTHGVIAYYLHHRTAVDEYMIRLEAWREHRRREARQHPPAVVQRLRTLQSAAPFADRA